MSTKDRLALEDRLGLNWYVFDEKSHITADGKLCKICEKKPCLTICPAEVYKLVEGKLVLNHENCIECGSCQIVCERFGKGAIQWYYPRGGFGITYRYG